MHRQVALQQSFPAEAAPAVRAGVAVVVEDHDVLAEGGLGVELHPTALQHLRVIIIIKSIIMMMIRTGT